MAVTVESFRKNFPEFGETTTYPETLLAFWLEVAVIMLPAAFWGSMYDLGLQLFLAHNLVLEKQAAGAAINRGDPGVNAGPVAGKTIGPVSVNYNTAEACAPGASHWNLTTYGTRFWRLAQLRGMGPIQVGIGEAPFPLNAWAGPWPYALPGGVGFA